MKISLKVNRLLTNPACIARRPGLPPELKRPVRSDEVVMTTQELNVPTELVFASGVAWRPPGASTPILDEL